MNEEKNQPMLFDDLPEPTEVEWQNMPEFVSNNLTPHHSIIVHFECREHMDEFSRTIEQKLTYRTPSVWFPKAEICRVVDKRYVSTIKKHEGKI